MFALNDLTKFRQVDEKVSRKVLGCGGSLLMAEVSFEKDGIGEIHSHEEYEQVSYIVKGSFKVTVGEETKILKAGDSFYADKNIPHGIIAMEDSIILDVFTPLRKDFIEV